MTTCQQQQPAWIPFSHFFGLGYSQNPLRQFTTSWLPKNVLKSKHWLQQRQPAWIPNPAETTTKVCTNLWPKTNFWTMVTFGGFQWWLYMFNCTVKPVYKGHPWDPPKAAVVQSLGHKWPLFTVYYYKILENWVSSWLL